MTEPSYDKQREKYFDLLQAAEDLLNDGVDPDSIIEYLNEKKEKELSRAFPFYGLFSSFLSANLAWKYPLTIVFLIVSGYFYPNKLIWLLSCIPSKTPNSLNKSTVESPSFAANLTSSIDINSSPSFAAS